MNFEEAQQRFAELAARYRRSDITVQQYQNEVNLLRVQDPSGRWWQPDSSTGGWLFYDGSMWRPGTLPLVQSPAPPFPPSPPVQVPPAPAAPGQYPPEKNPTVPPVYVLPQQPDDKKLMDTNTFREISRTTPWQKRPQKWWDLFSILMGAGTAIVWLMYSGLPKSSEGFDWISAVLMVGIPIALVTYRAEIDNFLVPLQPHRKHIPKLVLLGLGIAVPFLTAFILFNIAGVRNYPLMYWNMLIGTAASYALMREPVLAQSYKPKPGPDLKVPVLLLLLGSLLVRVVSADHCLSDPFNAQDCARSSGYGEAMAGGASAVVAGGINGPTLLEQLAMGAGSDRIDRVGAPSLDQQYANELEQVRITQEQLISLQTALNEIILHRLEEGYYVSNPDIWQQAIMDFPIFGHALMDWMIHEAYGNRTSRGTFVEGRPGHCEECQGWGEKWTSDLIKKTFGNDTILEQLVINADSYNNHIANQVILPNGDRYIIDIWQSLQDGQGRIYKEKDWIAKWQKKIGDPGKLGQIAPVLRNNHEILLEDLIREKGVSGGIEAFRHIYKNSSVGNSIINSFIKNPWFDPSYKPTPGDMSVPDLSNLEGKGPWLGGKRW